MKRFWTQTRDRRGTVREPVTGKAEQRCFTANEAEWAFGSNSWALAVPADEVAQRTKNAEIEESGPDAKLLSAFGWAVSSAASTSANTASRDRAQDGHKPGSALVYGEESQPKEVRIQ